MVGTLLLMRRFARLLRDGWHDPQFRALLGVVALTLVGGTVTMRIAEGWSWLDALYFSVVTLATVGYGDLAPSTAVGKVFVMLYILLGIGIIVAFADRLAKLMLDRAVGTQAEQPDSDRVHPDE